MPGTKYTRAGQIDSMLDTLAAYWQAHPDLRLGQIVSNAAAVINDQRNPTRYPDPFYLHDDDFVHALALMAED